MLQVNNNIRLERLNMNHAFQVFQAIDQNREFLSPWLPFVQDTSTQEDTESFIQTVTNKSNADRDEVFVIWVKNYFAGLIGYKDTDRVNWKTEIGYWLIKSMCGKGIVTLSVKELCNFAFSQMNMNRIQVKCAIGNQKSAAIPKRLGFHFEGIERAGEKHRQGYLDLEIYSMLKDEWEHSRFA
ncbi:GNAT family N-acetyltransferase [Sunxiuqinia sp. A32]|uniref:GNAT family N-acetyltransferase n=1 Tax=Sunxiuqinia sp. A32 TaxID=3461496 RepID=UPI0040454C09